MTPERLRGAVRWIMRRSGLTLGFRLSPSVLKVSPRQRPFCTVKCELQKLSPESLCESFVHKACVDRIKRAGIGPELRSQVEEPET
jgi:hypothetical protein